MKGSSNMKSKYVGLLQRKKQLYIELGLLNVKNGRFYGEESSDSSVTFGRLDGWPVCPGHCSVAVRRPLTEATLIQESI